MSYWWHYIYKNHETITQIFLRLFSINLDFRELLNRAQRKRLVRQVQIKSASSDNQAKTCANASCQSVVEQYTTVLKYLAYKFNLYLHRIHGKSRDRL